MKRYPTTPVQAQPVQATKSFDQKTALQILKEFYTEARKEIKGNTLVSLNTSEQSGSLNFICDGFNLSLQFTEGGVI